MPEPFLPGSILVTGGAGFIGSHVVEALLARGEDVHVLDDLSKGQLTNLPDRVPLHVLDIASSPLDRMFRDAAFDAVVHCAAQTNVMRSLAEPELDRRINVIGLARVLHAAVETGVRRFVFISSGGAAYGETPVPATEETPPQPDNPYGRHKVEGEAIVDREPLSTVSLRLSNVYGARQRSDAEGGVISIFADRLTAGLPLQVYGDGAQERDFVHVSDVVSAILLQPTFTFVRGGAPVARLEAGRASASVRSRDLVLRGVRVEQVPAGRRLTADRAVWLADAGALWIEGDYVLWDGGASTRGRGLRIDVELRRASPR